VKVSTTYIPVFLFILLLFSGITWSPVDSQAVADAGGDAAITLFSGKGGLIAGLVLMGVYLWAMPSPFRAFGAAMILFYCLALVSVLWTADTGTTVFAMANLSVLLISAAVANKLLGFRTTMRLVWLFSTGLILISVALAVIGDPHAMMGGMHVGRWRGLFAHKNSFGQFLAVNLLVTAFGRSILKLPGFLVYPMLLVDAVALVMANSATADIAAAGGLVVGIALLPIENRGLRTLWRILGVSAACLLGAVLLLQPDLVNNAVGRDASMSSRGEMWQAATPMTFQRTLGNGYGTGGGSQVSIELQKRMHRTTALSVQSGFLNTALELGWIAVILYLVWAGGALLSALLGRRAAPVQTVLAALIAVHLIESISEVNGCFGPSWLLLMALIPMVEVRRETPPRFRLTRRRYTSVAPANARTAAELPA
jgi:hypothetical protein